jgi:hypothetical protein
MVEWWLGQYAVSAALAQRCAVCRDFFAIVCMS